MSDLEKTKVSFYVMVAALSATAGACVYAGGKLQQFSDTLDRHTESITRIDNRTSTLESGQTIISGQITTQGFAINSLEREVAVVNQRAKKIDQNTR